MASDERNAGISRVAMLSLHTSPLLQPGTGDAGGMNVYIAKSAQALAELGIDVDVFTLNTSAQKPLAESRPEGAAFGNNPGGWRSDSPVAGVRVHTLSTPEARGASKEQLPALVDLWADAVAEKVAGAQILHSHYWLSGVAGLRIFERLGTPLVHTMHTIGAVKNLRAQEGEAIEPQQRIDAEREIAVRAAQLTANTSSEAEELANLCGADPARISIVHPGVEARTFTPGIVRDSRRELGISDASFVITFIGRLQPHKAPDLALRALAQMDDVAPELARRALLVICGGSSGSQGFSVESLAALADELGVLDRVRFMDPMPAEGLAILHRASDVVVMPSASESFGLVALEAQACGTPVVGTDGGGLRTSVIDGRSGLLVASRDPRDWALALSRVGDHDVQARMSMAAIEHASEFTWHHTAVSLASAYERAR